MAQVDYFLKIDGVEGESTDAKHKGEIVLESWSFGASNTITFSSGAGGGSGKVSIHDFHFTKKVDKASPRLFVACCSGEHLKTATLVCRKAGATQQEFLTVILTNVLVTSYDASGSAAVDGLPVDQVSLAFARIEIHERSQNPDGSLGVDTVGGWDVQGNKKI